MKTEARKSEIKNPVCHADQLCRCANSSSNASLIMFLRKHFLCLFDKC